MRAMTILAIRLVSSLAAGDDRGDVRRPGTERSGAISGGALDIVIHAARPWRRIVPRPE